ncbi:phosphoinositide phospholipase C 6-like [Chenopodium quinoa]|uniref:phosphoinositide phospholipase C 6-like n=1 Tax=Chenopodium quinoa TaxID=63459 RepID=UPI000B777A55|nr:phosphoinositide phospholipase C 6-like [Chenopodium quinoa]
MGSSSTHHNYKMFMCFNRKFKINDIQPPFDLVEAFTIYSQKGTHMNAAQLHRFLVDFQAEDTTEPDATRLLDDILRRRRHLSKFTRQGLTLDDFFFFLFSDDLNSPLNSQVHHDMTAPMQHYFIFTGHNSYLTGNQLSSDCSDVPIIKALQRGVRVIELDIWPNSAKDDINVLHGRTFTTPVSLIKCLKSIKEHAFVASSYPLIITLEDHLTPDLQAKVAKMVTEIFGEMLYCPECHHLEHFPSPEELKFRILLSTKPPKEYLEAKQSKDKGSASPASSGDDTQPNSTQGDSESDQDDEDSDAASDGKSGQLVAPQYKRLIAIHAGKPKNGLREALRTGLDKVKRLSLSEQALERAALNYGPDVVRFTQRNFLRIYPKGTRIRSSNYEPLVGWMHGAQMVAFNMQGYGKSLWLMQGMFRSNGGCGFVKKPDFLMKKGPNGEVFDPKAPLEVKKTLKVRAYLGDGWRLDFSKTHFDTFSPPDFYVKFRILGVPADYAKQKTKVIEDDWAPVWDQEFTFPLTVPELALLQIEVREYDMSEKDDFGGQTCLPISELKTGIRSVRLFDRKGEKLPSVRLLMRFQFS